ncbi:hypothetical protein ACJX0J_007314, partial [Zea mays]
NLSRMNLQIITQKQILNVKVFLSRTLLKGTSIIKGVGLTIFIELTNVIAHIENPIHNG